MTKVHTGKAEKTMPNWRKGETFNASEKFWLRKVGLWDNRAMTDETTWWGLVVVAAGNVAADDGYKFAADSLKRKYTPTTAVATAAPMKKAAGMSRK